MSKLLQLASLRLGLNGGNDEIYIQFLSVDSKVCILSSVWILPPSLQSLVCVLRMKKKKSYLHCKTVINPKACHQLQWKIRKQKIAAGGPPRNLFKKTSIERFKWRHKVTKFKTSLAFTRTSFPQWARLLPFTPCHSLNQGCKLAIKRLYASFLNKIQCFSIHFSTCISFTVDFKSRSRVHSGVLTA